MISLNDFKNEWLSDIIDGSPSTTILGNRFSYKILSQWLELDDFSDDVIFCDGACDGGIDVAFLQKAEEQDGGDTWYIVQSKYGSAFQGTDTLLSESIKVFDTLLGRRDKLSSLSSNVVSKIKNFIEGSSDKDRLVLVFATNDPMNDDEKRILEDVKILGKQKLGLLFDVETVCIDTIYYGLIENVSEEKPRTWLHLTGNFSDSGAELLVGSVKLADLFYFLKEYKNTFGDLDLIYEKNVRKFLGGRRKVNKGIAETLNNKPERFGLYNNGITIVTTDFRHADGEDKISLIEPYIVNGCQTTKTIWSILNNKLESGGSGRNEVLEEYKSRLDKGIVVVKVVKVGEDGEELLTETTRYTNSQNAVTDKDFLALESDFRKWSKLMANEYGIYLEIQRGGWESQKALQKQKPNTRPYFTEYANCFDLLKVYSSGWYGEAGLAFGKNPPFAPGGSTFKRITEDINFGLSDLYAAYILRTDAIQFKFGKGADLHSRAQTRYLFFMIFIELLKHIILKTGLSHMYDDKQFYSKCVIHLANNYKTAYQVLLNCSIAVIDEYLSTKGDDSYTLEPNYDGNVNNFLKSEKFGKQDFTPIFNRLLNDHGRILPRNSEYQDMLKCVTEANINFK